MTDIHLVNISTRYLIMSGYTKTVEKELAFNFKPVVSEVKLPTRIIIAEPNPDLRLLYSFWLHSIRFGFKDITITDSGRKCIDELLKLTKCNEESNKPQQDIIVILECISRMFLRFK